MTGGRKTSASRQTGNDVPQFAPNFTVYVLPPDVVCLYSEDRKFFLHGELYCALASAIAKGGKSFGQLAGELARDFPSDKIEEALKRLIERRYVVPAVAPSCRRSGGLLGEPRAATRHGGAESRELPGARRIDRRAGRGGVRRRPERTRRSRRQARARPHGHAGERLSRTTAGRIEPAARVRAFALAAGPAFRRLSAGRARVQPRRERLLDLPVRSHDTKPGGQGISRPRTCAPCRHLTSRAQRGRTRRHPVCGARSRQGHCYRLSHRVERSHRQSRSPGLDHRKALRRGPPAMSDLRPQEAAGPAPRAAADRAWRRRQAGHDQRRIPDGIVAGDGGALPQACEPSHRRGHAARADRSRSAAEHQFLCRA